MNINLAVIGGNWGRGGWGGRGEMHSFQDGILRYHIQLSTRDVTEISFQ